MPHASSDPDPVPDAGLAPAWAILALVAALAVAGIVQTAILPTNSDAAWYLYMGGRILDGARPYVDVVDTNPPLIVWLNVAIVAVARGIGLAPLRAFPAVVVGLIGLSLALSWRLSRGLPLAMRQAGLVSWTYLLLVNPGVTFGQREHVMMALILPYAWGAVAEARGDRPTRGLAAASGLLAGLGLAIKPFFVLAGGAVELYLAVRRGPRVWLRPQGVALGLVFVVYGFGVVAGSPRYLTVAREFAPLYPHHGPEGPVLLASSWRLPLVAATLALGWGVGRRRAPGWSEVFGLLAAGFTAAVYLTGKGWMYHWLPPCSIASAMLCEIGALATLGMAPGRARGFRAVGLGLFAPTMAALALGSSALFWRDPAPERLVRAHVRRGESVVVLSPWLYRAFPLVNESGARWGLRHPMVWQTAAFHADGSWPREGYHAWNRMTAPERRFVGEIAEDFARSRPALLMVDEAPPRPWLRGFDYLRYFAADPRFSRALADYELFTRTIDFRVYRRRDRDRRGPMLARGR